MSDLTNISKAGTHDFSRNIKGLVIVIDALHRDNAWIIGATMNFILPLGSQRLFVPIRDTSNKWRNQLSFCLGASHCLNQAKQEGHIASDTFGLKSFRRLNAFPSTCYFDEHSFFRNAIGLIGCHDFSGLFNGALCIKR